jgi:hypothetical protein
MDHRQRLIQYAESFLNLASFGKRLNHERQKVRKYYFSARQAMGRKSFTHLFHPLLLLPLQDQRPTARGR